MKKRKILSLVLGVSFLAVFLTLVVKERELSRQVDGAASTRGSATFLIEKAGLIEGAGTVAAQPRAERALKAVPGVLEANVSYPRRTAVVTYDSNKVKIPQLVAALESVGFKVSPAQARYVCPTCQATYHAAGACLICEASLKPIER